MPTSLGDNKDSHQDQEGLGVLWIFALIAVLVLVIAAFNDIVF
jgi:hypothetical protein